MARDRFEAIHHTMFHVSDNDEKKAKDKIEQFMNELIHQFQAAFYPFQNVSIVEMLIKYKGRWKNKQYNPPKSDFSNSEKIFEYLFSPLGSGHHVFADKFYTTYSLIQYLTNKKYFYRGTIQSNQKNFLDEIKQPVVKYQERKYGRRFLVVLWKDKNARKPVIAVSSKFVKGSVEVCTKWGKKTNKPDMICNYNQ